MVGKSKTIQAQPIVSPLTIGNSLEQPSIAQAPEDTTVFMVVEQMPEFPGGTIKMMEYIGGNIVYPKAAAKDSIQGRVITQFTINTDGSIINPIIIRGVDPSLDQAALDVIMGMPKWIPGKQRGQTVRVRYTIPVTFKL